MPVSAAPQKRASVFDVHIDKLQVEVAEAHILLANNSADLEALRKKQWCCSR